MLEIKRVESISAKPSEFHEVHEYVCGADDDVHNIIVRLFDKEAGIRINIYYYLTEGLITVFWGDDPNPRHVRFESGDLGSMYEAFDEVKYLVEQLIQSEQS
nr:MAG TPA: hypothetical protein [Caudoviricetes sp.]